MDLLYSMVSLIGLAVVGLVMAECLCRFAPKLVSAKAPDHYHGSLHGLRGALALLILVHACWAWFGFARTGEWTAPSIILENARNFAMMLFFALSGFLYWEKQ